MFLLYLSLDKNKLHSIASVVNVPSEPIHQQNMLQVMFLFDSYYTLLRKDVK